MTREGSSDAFERRYMARFEAVAADYGLVVKYQRDRAARDIGVHFLRKTRSGHEEATGSLVWFQMKGLQAKTLSKEEFAKARTIAIRMRVKDLQLWYRMNGPTYLVVYLESVDRFLILNILEYVEKNYGRAIFTLKQKSVEVPVPVHSVLDKQAFALLMRKGAAAEWARVISADESEIHLCQRDYRLLWRIGTAKKRKVEHRVHVTDWQSKLRGEVKFLERKVGATDEEWYSVREHWQLMLRIEKLEGAYPYLAFEAFDQQREDDIEYWSNEDNEPFVEFSDGTVVHGEDCASEYHAYELRPRMNNMGERLLLLIQALSRASLIELRDNDDSDDIDVAPWHHRSV